MMMRLQRSLAATSNSSTTTIARRTTSTARILGRPRTTATLRTLPFTTTGKLRCQSTAAAVVPSSFWSWSSSGSRRPRPPQQHPQQRRRNYTIPIVLESGVGGERSFDIYSRLLRERIICVHGEITDPLASVVTAQLLFLEAEAPDQPIAMYINSPGGSVSAGLAMYDTMQYIRPDVHTIAMGQAASMGSLLLAGGAPGCRAALPHATIMLHQPSGGASGMASDIVIRSNEIVRLRTQLNQLYLHHITHGRALQRENARKNTAEATNTQDDGKTKEGEAKTTRTDSERESGVVDPAQLLHEIEGVMDRDTFMTTEQALQFGIIDTILTPRTRDTDDDENDVNKYIL